MIIGLIGFKQVGKSTAAKYLEEKYGFVRHNMKDGLVEELKQNFPLVLAALLDLFEIYPELWKSEGATETSTMEVTIDNLFVVKPRLVRELMKNYGTDVRRDDDPDYWVKKWIDYSEYLFVNDGERQVVDDIRFPNEAAAAKSAKCPSILIHMVRPDITTGGDHKSETEHLSIKTDYVVEAIPGDLRHLERELDRIMDEILTMVK